jgi:long-chain acyl-CoA synthetase
MKNHNYPIYECDKVTNLKELVALAARKHGEKHAFTYEHEKQIININYKQFKSNIERLSASLVNIGLDDKAAVLGENSYKWILSYFAIVNSGCVVVPLDKELPANEIKNLIDHSEVKMLIYSVQYKDIIEHMQQIGTKIKHYICMDELDILLANEAPSCDVKVGGMAAILYTSGTTGSAKGVILSHEGITHNAIAACQYVKLTGKSLLVLPLHHVFGFVCGVCSMLLQGKEICINSSLKNVLMDIQKFKPHTMFLVPLFVETFYKKIWDGAKQKGKDGLLRKLIGLSNFLQKINIDIRRKFFKSVLSNFGGNLDLIICGGAPLDEKYEQGLRDFGVQILNGYGITECSPVVSVNRNEHWQLGSIGRVLPCCEVQIAEPNDDGDGEILVRGSTVMLGYYKNESATVEAMDSDWFKTGDIGHLNKDGFLYISGRKKNLIILSNGKNIYPEEVEFALLSYIPYIKEVVVSQGNDKIIAEVFLDIECDPACVKELDNDIVNFNRTVPIYKNIAKTIIRDTEFPKTTTKKIKRSYK